MTKQFIYLQGKAKWANRLVRPDDKFNRWSVVLYPDQESLEKVRELQAEGVKNVIKKDEDGYNVTLSRPLQKIIRGKVIAFTPPKLVHPNKEPVVTAIGNGSDITVEMEVYSHGTPTGGKAKAMRLESVRVDNLVPFDAETDYPDAKEAKSLESIGQQPERLF